MKTLKANKIAVIKNSHSAEEIRQMQKEFISKETVKYTLEELIKAESARKAKA